MTPLMSNEEFVKASGSKCPCCSSLRVEYGDREEDGSNRSICSKCGAEWYEQYEMVGYTLIEAGDLIGIYDLVEVTHPEHGFEELLGGRTGIVMGFDDGNPVVQFTDKDTDEYWALSPEQLTVINLCEESED